jgi:hypothetical protein
MTTKMQTAVGSFKKISWGEVVAICAIILSFGGFTLSRIDRQFDRIDKKFNGIENTLQTIERDNRDFHGRLSHLEGKINQ